MVSNSLCFSKEFETCIPLPNISNRHIHKILKITLKGEIKVKSLSVSQTA